MSTEGENKREPLYRDGSQLWPMGDFAAGDKGWCYGDGSHELLKGPDPERAGGIPVAVKDPLGRNERARLTRNGGEWEARRA